MWRRGLIVGLIGMLVPTIKLMRLCFNTLRLCCRHTVDGVNVDGVSVVAIIGQSHLTLHTWPVNHTL